MMWRYMRVAGIDVDAMTKRVSCLINESGLTDRIISNTMGLSVQSVNKWRKCHGIPDIENMYMLSRILDIKVDDFFVPIVEEYWQEIEFASDSDASERKKVITEAGRRLLAYSGIA